MYAALPCDVLQYISFDFEIDFNAVDESSVQIVILTQTRRLTKSL